MKPLPNNEPLQQTAFKKEDGLNYETTPIFKVNQKGSPIEKVDAIAYEKDVRAFWMMHEKKLWLILLICSFYFFGVII
jgi:hypothetical protein